MKTRIILLTFVLTSARLYAQSTEASDTAVAETQKYEIRTLAPKGRMAHGGYGGLTAYYSRIKGQDAFSVGARFAYLMNHVFALGFTGTGFVNDIPLKNILPGEEVFLQGGYGGMLFEPVVAGRFPVHVTFPVMIGAGGIVYNKEAFFMDIGEEDGYEDWEVIDSDVFFAIEPGVNLEFNITRFFRLGMEAKYRYVNGLQMINTDSKMLNGWSGGLNLKFGFF